MRDRPYFSIDLPKTARAKDSISDVLSLLDTRAHFSASLATGGDWAIYFPGNEGLKFCAIVRGKCWLAVDGMAQPVELNSIELNPIEVNPIELNQGDCFLITTDTPYRLASDLSLEPIDARAVYAEVTDGRAAYRPSRKTMLDSMLLGGRFSFDRTQTSILLDSLPPVIHIRAKSTQAAIIACIAEELMEELSTAAPGAALMVDHLAHMLFVQVLRAYLASGEKLPVGWLGALTEPRVGLTLDRIHQNPGRRWTLDDLALAAGMSRSAFCALFKKLVGMAPLDYLLRWRMQLATKALRKNTKSVATIALSLGYGSESAFGNAFKRVIGKAPGRYQREVYGNDVVD